MCGIAGTFGPMKNSKWLKFQTHHLKLRGPDSQIFSEIDSYCDMAACRLAMTDPQPRSNQPFKDLLSGNLITFNGEIFNFRKLRAELIATFPSEKFYTDSDTEVLLRLLDKYGPSALVKLQGMFAFAYYKVKEKEVWLSRDVLGKKPLYWTCIDGTLYWSSSQNSFNSLRRPETSQDVLIQFLSLGYLIDPYSMDNETQAIMPGSLSIFRDTENVKRDEEMFFEPNMDLMTRSTGSIRDLIAAATEVRIEGHENIALSLSGGIDSCIIALLLTKYTERIKCFTAVWSDSDKERYNTDARTSQQIAKNLSLDHEIIEMPLPKEIPGFLDEFLMAMEEPNGNPTGVSLFALYSGISEQKYRVVLTGDGSDEILGGYKRYKKLGNLPNFPLLRNSSILDELVDYRGRGKRRLSTLILTLTDPKNPKSWLYWHLITGRNELRNLLKLENFDKEYERALIRPITFYTNSDSPNPVYNLMQRDHKIWLNMESNRKLDRVSMHFSIEARSPFQDERVIGWALKNIKQNNVESGEKHALRKAFPELATIGVRRDKAGFISPLGYWLRMNPNFVANSIKYLKSTGDFNSEYLAKLEQSPSRGNFRDIKKLWHVIVWSRWKQIQEG